MHTTAEPSVSTTLGRGPRPGRPARDVRLDFWRGLCLVDMVLVHLVHQGLTLPGAWGEVLGDWTRFAAGGFIFIAGLSIGAIFLPRARDPQRRWGVYRGLLKRSAALLAVHYAAEICFLLRYPLLADQPFGNIWRPMMEVLLFRNGSDLLLFYAIMLLAAPLMLHALVRGWWWIVALASLAVWGLGQIDPYFGTVPIQQTFLVPLWQVIFVAGMLGGVLLPGYDRLALRWRAVIATGITLAAVLLTLSSDGWRIGFVLHLGLTFWKVPLTAGEVLRYLAWILMILTVSDLAWGWLKNRPAVGAVARLGRNSLAIYVAHVFVVATVIALANHTTASPMAHLLWIVPAVGVLWGIAWVIESVKLWPAALRAGFDRAPFPTMLVVRVAAAVAVVPLVNHAYRAWTAPPSLHPPVAIDAEAPVPQEAQPTVDDAHVLSL